MSENFQDDKVIYNYQTNETKYYFLTGGSGYPLAEFMPQGVLWDGGTATGLIVAEKRQKTTNTVPWTDLPSLDLKPKK